MNNYPVYNPYIEDRMPGGIPILNRDTDLVGDFHGFFRR
jgi:hypothetical protein